MAARLCIYESDVLLEGLEAGLGVGVVGGEGEDLVVVVACLCGVACLGGGACQVVVHGHGVVDVRTVLVGGNLLEGGDAFGEVVDGHAAGVGCGCVENLLAAHEK